MFDVLIIGGGPAGLSAAVNVAAMGKSCALLSNDFHANPLYRAAVIDNYAGMRGVSGKEMMERLHDEASQAGTTFFDGRVISLLPFEDYFMAAIGQEMIEGKRLILATGALQAKALPGEEHFLGQGVSYCAVCDGMLYRGRRAIVTGNASHLAEEAALLQKMGVQVTVVTKKPLLTLPAEIPQIQAKKIAVQGSEKMEGLLADEQLLPCDVIFVLQEVMAPSALLGGLILENGFIRVNRNQETNVPGVYAAGDCTGKPLQIAKAVGEGLIAAQNAVK